RALWPHANDTTAPVMMPAAAPGAFRRRQYSDARMTGPNAEPKPAQAKPTRSRIDEFGFAAMTPATTATTATAMRDASIAVDDFRSLLTTPRYRSSISADDDTSSCDEMVDMIAASTAVRIRPATSGWKMT